MSTRLFVSLLAGAFMIPLPALSADDFRLPPIPYAETIPWLTGSASAPAPAPSSLGILLTPQTMTQMPQFASVPSPDRRSGSQHYASDRAFSTE